MKKFLFNVLLIGCAYGVHAQGIKEGNVLIDVFYGGPNVISNWLNADVNVSGWRSSTDFKGLGPFGGRVEYMITDRASLGLEVHHASSEYTRTIEVDNGNNSVSRFKDEFKVNRTRIYPRFAYHFGKDKLDVFWQMSLGFVNWSSEYKVLENTDNSFGSVTPITFTRNGAIGFRTGVGVRYYFNDFIGINADIGLGGPLVTAGLSFKIN